MRKVLGIETSCDETAAAIVTEDKQILANVILSQQEHEEFGGVVPEVAARAHLDYIDTIIEKALSDANLTLEDIDAISVTSGPGLIGGVLVGVVTAKAIASVTNKPIIPINHLAGHALVARVSDSIEFPYLLLLVSGGHCQLLIAESANDYKLLGSTLDDALGECFDKSAKLLGLGYPGGPKVEKMAKNCTNPEEAIKKYLLPKPMVGKDNCDFSFSGMKTAVKRIIDTLPTEVPLKDAQDICYSFQYHVEKVLADRLKRAVKQYKELHPNLKNPTLVVSGGVAANKFLRASIEEIAKNNNLSFSAPPLKLCTDNGVMIAWAGMEKLINGDDIEEDINFPVYPRWPLDKNSKRKK